MATTPAYTKQIFTASCWAACMEALGGLSLRVARHNQMWYVDRWGVGPPTGGLDYLSTSKESKSFDNFCTTFGFSRTPLAAGHLTEDKVLLWLAPGSDYFILIEQQSSNTSHARLAYAWKFNPEVGGGIAVMDPDPSSGGKKILFPADLQQGVVLHW